MPAPNPSCVSMAATTIENGAEVDSGRCSVRSGLGFGWRKFQSGSSVSVPRTRAGVELLPVAKSADVVRFEDA